MSSIIAEFTIPATEFAFGDALLTDPSMQISIERIVPTGNSTMPYIWVRNGDFSVFEETVKNDPNVVDIVLIDEIDHDRLYRVTWTGSVTDLITGINESEGTIMEASGKETWNFRLRFPSHDRLRRFYNYITDTELRLHLDRIFTLPEIGPDGFSFAITPEQREALVLAVEGGYFEIPRETTIREVAETLGISDQATSERIRRGANTILREVLL